MSDGKVEFHDIELRRQLSLTTADLRFADHLVRSISDEKGNIFLDSTGTHISYSTTIFYCIQCTYFSTFWDFKFGLLMLTMVVLRNHHF